MLRDALVAGRISRSHVYAVTDAAAGRVGAALGEVEAVLHGLALASTPRALRSAVRRVGEVLARDGVDAPPEPIVDSAPDPRRELHLRPALDGLGDLAGTLDQLVREKLAVALDAFGEPDPADVPVDQRRTPAQCRHDALDQLLDAALAAREAGTIHGHTPRVTLTLDLLALFDGAPPTAPAGVAQAGAPPASAAGPAAPSAGKADPRDVNGTLARLLEDVGIDLDDLLAAHNARTPASACSDEANAAAAGGAAPAGHRGGPPRKRTGPRLRFSGPYPLNRARALLLAAQVTVLLTCGPWRCTSVGRSMRTLPAWLREAMFAFQPCCRGPDCDRPAMWTQAHHTVEWAVGGATDLDHSIPLCHAHHDLVTTKGWRVTLDPPTGICTWTAPDGRTFTTHPTA